MLTPQEEEDMRQLAGRHDVQDIVAQSIAPSIYGGMGKGGSLSLGGLLFDLSCISSCWTHTHTHTHTHLKRYGLKVANCLSVALY